MSGEEHISNSFALKIKFAEQQPSALLEETQEWTKLTLRSREMRYDILIQTVLLLHLYRILFKDILTVGDQLLFKIPNIIVS